MPTNAKAAASGRRRGRPRLRIDRDAVADAVMELFTEGGYEAVSIVAAAEKLSVSRATLYRTVASKGDLLGILYERATDDLTRRIKMVLADISDPAQQLRALVGLQAQAAVQMRWSMPIFFGGGALPPDVLARWHTWSRQFEKMWVQVVTANMRAGYLEDGDPVITTRLILGMMLWVSRWYRPTENIAPGEIADAALNLFQLNLSPRAKARPAAPRRTATLARTANRHPRSGEARGRASY